MDEEKKYSICLSVPIGKRNGILYLQKKGCSVSGWMDLMGYRNPFSGNFTIPNKIEISGTLKTLINAINYSGTGIIAKHTVSIELITDHDDHYFIYGEEKCN